MKKKLLLLTLFFLGAIKKGHAAGVYRGGAELLNSSAYSVQAETLFFTPTAHLDVYGNKYEISPDSDYKMFDSDFKISYGLSSNLETSLFVKVRSVSSSDGLNTSANIGPESAGVQCKYAFEPIDALKYAIGIKYRQTIYTNTRYTTSQVMPVDEVILGDDGSEYGIDLYATYKASSSWKLDFKVGYNSPPNDLSSEIVLKAQALYQFRKLSLFVGIDAIYSLKRDQFTNAPELKPRMSTGETNQFNSINREVSAPYLGINYSFDKILLFIKGQSIIAGKSTDQGHLLLAGISWNTEGVTPESVKIDSFKEYHIDGAVLKVTSGGNYIKIDQGLSTDVEKGAHFDIYQTDYFGGNILVGSGVIHEVGSDWSVIKLIKKYNDIQIKPGFAARGY